MRKKLGPDEVHEKVRRRYAEIACSIKDRFKYPIGMEGLLMLGYDLQVAGTFLGGLLNPSAVSATLSVWVLFIPA